MVKKLCVVLFVLVAAAAGLLFYLNSNIDSIVKAAIEKFGSQAAHTALTLDSVKLEIASGAGALYGLGVSNPEGFSSNKALQVEKVSMKIDAKSALGDGPIIIDEIAIDKIKVLFEADATGANNLLAMQKNITPKSSSSKSNESDAINSAGENKAQRKIIIRNLYIRDGGIEVTHPLLNGKNISAVLPEIHLTNIGEDKGVTQAQLAKIILQSITSSASKVATKDIAKQLGGSLENIKEGAAQEVIEGVKGFLPGL